MQYYADSVECLLNRYGKRSWGNGKITMGTPNEVVLCIDQVEEYRFTGRLYHAYSAADTVFLSMDEAVFQMEQLYDSLNYPYPGTIIRSFGKKQFWEQAVRQERKRAMSEEELLGRHG